MNSSSNIGETEVTDTPVENTESQASKSYSQQEVDAMMARMRGSLEKKLLKPYQDLGDPEELRQMRQQAEQLRQSEQIKRGEFEKTLQELAQKKDAEISKRDSVIKEYKVNAPILDAAARYRAVAPEQVRALLSSNVRLNTEGEVEVLDNNGAVRYNDRGEPLPVTDLVREFLDSNPHFRAAGPANTNTRSSVSTAVTGEVDVSKLDMKLAEHRKLFRQIQSNKAR